MAMTDTSAADVELHAGPHDPHADPDVDRPVVPAGFANLFGTGDHKAIGRLFIGFSLLFGVASLVLLALGALGQKSGASFPDVNAILQISTLGRVGAVFFFLLPLLVGIGVYVCPLQVGAATVAFPRAVAASFWTWLIASAMSILAWLLDGGPGGGEVKMVDLSYFSLGVAIVALLIAGIAVATTVITFRAPGMTLDKVPFFSWSMVVAVGVWCLTLPVLLGELMLLYVDHHYALSETFSLNLPTAQWAMLSWAFSAPQVFAYAIPAVGIAADAVTTLGKGRHPQRSAMFAAIGLLGVFSIGAWVQPAFFPGITRNWGFMAWSVSLALPPLVVLGGLGLGLRKGKPSGASPLLGGVLTALALLVGGLGAALFGIGALDLDGAGAPERVQELMAGVWFQPPAQVGVFGIVVLAAAVGAMAGLSYWGAKITGHQLSDGPGKAAMPLVFLGALLYGAPLIVVGFAGKTESLGSAGTIDTLSYVSLAGAAIAALGVLAMGLGLLGSLAAGAAEGDPWGVGQTLEWATASPPPRGNFGELPSVTSAEPLLDARTGADSKEDA